VVLEYLNFSNKVINELVAIDVKVDEEDKVLILLSSLSESHDHLITTMIYDKKTLILKEVKSTLLSNEIRKRPNQEEKEGPSLVVTGKKGREEGKKSSDSSNACHFCYREGNWKNDCKH